MSTTDAMKVENDEKYNSINVKAECDDIPIAYVVTPKEISQRDDLNSTIPAATVITEEEFFNLNGYILETDLKFEATKLQDRNDGPTDQLQAEDQSYENESDNKKILCPKNILVKVKKLPNRMMTEMLCRKKVVLKVKRLSAEMMKKYATKPSCKKSSYQCSVCHKGYPTKMGLLGHQQRRHKCKFSCKLCSKSYSHEGALKQHLQQHLGENTANVKTWHCPFCQMRFFTSQELAVHRATHTDLFLYQCPMCPMNFTNSGHLYQHKREHENDLCIEKPFECYLCKKKLGLLHYLQAHMRIHTKKYDCRICMEIFNQEEDLDNHMLKHSGKYRFECSHCSKGFDYRTSFVRHVRIHTKEKPFKCEYCEKTFKEKDYLLAHKRTHTGDKTVDRTKYTWRYKNEHKFRRSKTNCRSRTNDRRRKEFKCLICFKIFTNEKELNDHFDGHTGKYLYECSLCKKGFDYGPNLYRHMKSHEGRKPYKCDLCPRKYADSGSLKAHIRCHNGEKVECEICLQKFTEKGYLKIHRRVHTGERPFQCAQCKATFRAKQSLKLHICYRCDICSLYFPTKSVIRSHMVVHGAKLKMKQTSTLCKR